MAYFTNFLECFFLCSDILPEEKRKLDEHLWILKKSRARGEFLKQKNPVQFTLFLRFSNNIIVA